jgi:transcription-repair coupling factor (superfamily II helicase)
MAELPNFSALDELDSELDDRFGPIPEPVRNLLFQLKIKLLATQAGIDRIATEGTQIVIEMPEERQIPELKKESTALRRSKRGVWLGTSTPSWRTFLEALLRAFAK